MEYLLSKLIINKTKKKFEGELLKIVLKQIEDAREKAGAESDSGAEGASVSGEGASVSEEGASVGGKAEGEPVSEDAEGASVSGAEG